MHLSVGFRPGSSLDREHFLGKNDGSQLGRGLDTAIVYPDDWYTKYFAKVNKLG